MFDGMNSAEQHTYLDDASSGMHIRRKYHRKIQVTSRIADAPRSLRSKCSIYIRQISRSSQLAPSLSVRELDSEAGPRLLSTGVEWPEIDLFTVRFTPSRHVYSCPGTPQTPQQHNDRPT